MVQKMNYVECMGKKKFVQNSIGKPQEERQLGRARYIREDNIKNICIYLKEAA